MMINIARRASNGSRRNSNETGGTPHSGLGYGDMSGSSESSLPSDASDKESLQSWRKKNGNAEGDEDDLENMGAKEKEDTRRWFLVITALMILAGTGITVYTYYYLTGQEDDDFERSFQQSGQSIAESIEYHVQVIQQALRSKSQALTTFAAFTGANWPYVSIPDFQPQGQNFLAETKTEMVAFAPLIASQRKQRAWEAYSLYMLESSGWFPSTTTEEESDELIMKQLEKEYGEGSTKTGSEGENSDLYIPVWQIAPSYYANVWTKQNLTEHLEQPIATLLRTKQPVWTPFLDLQQQQQQQQQQQEKSNNLSNATSTPTSTLSLPASFVLHPVFRALPSMDVQYDKRNKTEAQLLAEQQEVVGIYMSAIQWDHFLVESLPEGAVGPGVQVVISNNYGQVMTYQIDDTDSKHYGKSTPTWMGAKDVHGSTYDDMAIYSQLAVGQGSEANYDAHAHRALLETYNESITSEDQQGPSSYFVAIYPTSAYKDSVVTEEPFWITTVMAILFFLAILVFFFYARFVHNRQQQLVQKANSTALVVKSLFPANVRDRIMQEAKENHSKKQRRDSRKTKKDDRNGSSSGRNGSMSGGGGRDSILGGMSLGSTGSRNSRMSRKKRRGSQQSAESNYGIATRSNSMGATNPYGSQPIADHFAATTIMFADMVGFTAWSSVREPTQVFTLLETVYHAFDKVARKRGIFKVETIGDCYVAVCGLPVPRPDHAIAMSYFANDCLRKMNNLTKKLEVTLGPDTGDLSMRVGLHSGPVTAGVLRGEKSRFQLFGDTVNTAARMESNGKKDSIHVSEQTAKLLIESGKSRWLSAREDKIVAKGKGELQTYWLEVRSLSSYIEGRRASGEFGRRASGQFGRRASGESGQLSTDGGSSCGESMTNLVPAWERDVSSSDKKMVLGERFQRLVDWNVDVLIRLLKKMVANRKLIKEMQHPILSIPTEEGALEASEGEEFDLRLKHNVLDQQTDVIAFPRSTTMEAEAIQEDIELDSQVILQLHEFMTSIATFYQDHAFHNFAHASHVTMATLTWLSRLMPPARKGKESSGDWRKSSSDESLYALTSDPLTQFSLVFAALVHDCEHPGVTNSELVKEKDEMATMYKDKSIHEQASIELAFETLMHTRYSELRKVLFTTKDEFTHFRQIVINCVLSTDILDDHVMANQNVRWGLLFRDHEEKEDPGDEDVSASEYEPENEGDQKASLIAERLILISNISHTMQHWYVYRKWNEKLFEERYDAFKNGRSEEDPSINWYESELEFFDNYVIPLAAKMKECKIFGSLCDESLEYAKSNREQWEATGKDEVASMQARFKEIVFEVDDRSVPVSEAMAHDHVNQQNATLKNGDPPRFSRTSNQPNGPKRPFDLSTTREFSKASFDTVFGATKK